MGTNGGAFTKNLWAREWASSLLYGRGPQDGTQKLFLETSLERNRIGREVRRQSWWQDEERQLGKPGPNGKPIERIARRSGGNVKFPKDSTAENSSSVRPHATWTSEDLRAAITVLAYAAKEKQTLRVLLMVGC